MQLVNHLRSVTDDFISAIPPLAIIYTSVLFEAHMKPQLVFESVHYTRIDAFANTLTTQTYSEGLCSCVMRSCRFPNTVLNVESAAGLKALVDNLQSIRNELERFKVMNLSVTLQIITLLHLH
jgi:hypothetical protein